MIFLLFLSLLTSERYLPREEEREELLLREEERLPTLDEEREELDEELTRELEELLLLRLEELTLDERRLEEEELLLTREVERVLLLRLEELTLDERRLEEELTPERFDDEEEELPPLVVTALPREEREEELLTPLVPPPRKGRCVELMVEPLNVEESSFLLPGLNEGAGVPPSVRVRAPPRRVVELPAVGRAELPPEEVPLFPFAISVPPRDSSLTPPKRSP